MGGRFALNDEMYAWRADAQRYIEKGSVLPGVNWTQTFAGRTVWLVNELERIVKERDLLRKRLDKTQKADGATEEKP